MRIRGPEKKLALIRRAEKVLLFLDYDGTLADFAPTPDDIFPDPDLISLLSQLQSDERIRVSVISGRRLSHIQKLVPVKGILLAGTYGIEVMWPDGRLEERVEYDQVRPVLDGLKPGWLRLTESTPGLYLEDKGWSLALHAKEVEDSIAEDNMRIARGQIPGTGSFQEGFRVMGGHKFLEVAPVLANKGSTVNFLIKSAA